MKSLAFILTTMTLFILPTFVRAEMVEERVLRLRHNPFDRPLLTKPVETTPTETRATKNDNASQLTLRATMVGNDSAMANINGNIIEVGETINGFRLMQVSEDRTVLLKNGRQVVLTIENDR